MIARLITFALIAFLLAISAQARVLPMQGFATPPSGCPSPTSDGSVITAPTPCTLDGTFGPVGIGSTPKTITNVSGIATSPNNYDLTGAGATGLSAFGGSAQDPQNWNNWPLQGPGVGSGTSNMPVDQLELNNGGNLYMRYSNNSCPTSFALGSPNPDHLWFVQRPASNPPNTGIGDESQWFQVAGPSSSVPSPLFTSSNGHSYYSILDVAAAGPAGSTVNIPVMPTGIPFYWDAFSGRQSGVGLNDLTANFAAGVKMFCSSYGSKGVINISGYNNVFQGDATTPAVIGNNNSGLGGNAYGINLDAFTSNLTLKNFLVEGSYTVIHGSVSGVSNWTNVSAQFGDMMRDFFCGGFGLGHNIYINGGGAAGFTGSISGTTLTASNVLGVIQLGATVGGTGVVYNTTIVQQLSGTTGEAGTYQVSISQTVGSTSMNTPGIGDNDNFTVNGGFSVNVLGDNDPVLNPGGNNGGDLLKMRLSKSHVTNYTLGGNLTGITIPNLSECPQLYITERWPYDVPCGGVHLVDFSTIETPANTDFFGGHSMFATGDETSNPQHSNGNCGTFAHFEGDVLASNRNQLVNVPVNPAIWGVPQGGSAILTGGYDPIYGFGGFNPPIASYSGPDVNGLYTITITPDSNGYGLYLGYNSGPWHATISNGSGGAGNTLTINGSDCTAPCQAQLHSGQYLMDLTGSIAGNPQLVSGSGLVWTISGSAQNIATEEMTTNTLSTCLHGGLGWCSGATTVAGACNPYGGTGINCDVAFYTIQTTASTTLGSNQITVSLPYNPTDNEGGYYAPIPPVGWTVSMPGCLPSGTLIATPRPSTTVITGSNNASANCTNQPLTITRTNSLTIDHDYLIMDAPNGGDCGNTIIDCFSDNTVPITITNSVIVKGPALLPSSVGGNYVINGVTNISYAALCAVPGYGNRCYDNRTLAAAGEGWSGNDQFGNPCCAWPYLPLASDFMPSSPRFVERMLRDIPMKPVVTALRIPHAVNDNLPPWRSNLLAALRPAA